MRSDRRQPFGDHRGLALALAIATALPGQQRAIGGVVLDRAGAAATSGTVLLRWRVHPELPGIVGHTLGDAGIAELRVEVDEHGRFQLQPPHGGPFELTALAASAADRTVPAFPVMEGAFVELRLAAPVFVGGTVRNAEGEPLAMVTVTLRPQNTTWTRLAGYRMPEARGVCTTDAAGQFRLLLPDSYLRGPRWEAFVVPDFEVAGIWPKQEVLLRPTSWCSDLDLRLVATQFHAGIVLGPDGAALAHATVFDSTAPQRAVRTGADGTFVLPARFRRDLFVLAAGCAISPLPALPPLRGLPVGPGIPEPPARVHLQAGNVLRARLVDPDDRPLAHAPVLWSVPLASGWPLEFATTTDDDGIATFDRAGNGFGVLGFVAIAGVYLPFARAEPTADVDLGVVRVGEPRRLSGQVLDQHGTPLPGSRVAVLVQARLRDEAAYITYSDHGGRFRFLALPAGPLEVAAEASLHGLVQAGVPAHATSIELRATDQGVVEGVVNDGEGNPVPGAWVTLTRSGGVDEGLCPGPSPRMTAVCGLCDEQGRFTFRGLPSGDWQVIANSVRDGFFHGGGSPATTDGAAILVRLRRGPG